MCTCSGSQGRGGGGGERQDLVTLRDTNKNKRDWVRERSEGGVGEWGWVGGGARTEWALSS